MQTKEPSWRRQSRQAARRYCANLRALSRLEAGAPSPLPNAPASKRGRLVRPKQALDAVAQRRAYEQRLRREVEAVDYALEMAGHKSMGESIRRIFELVYAAQSHTLSGAAMQLPCSESTARRYDDFFLTMIACALGLIEVRES